MNSLEQILNDKLLYKEFEGYLKTDAQLNYLNFLCDTKTLQEGTSNSNMKLEEIINKYIKVGSKSEIGIGEKERMNILEKYMSEDFSLTETIQFVKKELEGLIPKFLNEKKNNERMYTQEEKKDQKKGFEPI
jgi:hypothetical protein